MNRSAFKKLLLGSSKDPVVEITDQSIELDVEDLLDIDGSDDQTLALSRGMKKLAKRGARVSPAAPVQTVPVPTPSDRLSNRATTPFGLEKHAPKLVEKTTRMSSISSPAHLAFAAAPPKNPLPPPSVRDAGSTFEPVAANTPAHFAANQPRERKPSASYPPIAIVVNGHREKALSFIQERPSRAGWIAAAIIAVVLVISGSIRVQSVAPAAAAPPAELTPLPAAALEEAPKPVEPKVVQFADDQGIAIKPKAAASAKHPVAPAKPAAAKPAAPRTEVAAKSEPKAEKKKPAQTIDAELAEMQLRAASR